MNARNEKIGRLGRVAIMGVALLGIGHYATAQNRDAGKALSASEAINQLKAQPDVVAAPLQAVNHVLKGTYISSGTLGGAFLPPGTYSAVDAPQTITCPGTSGTCTIQADHWVELSGTTANNTVWVCLAVDGVFDSNCGFIDDKIRPDGSWQQVTSSHATSAVPYGTHTVQTFIDSYYGAEGAYFNINYRVYKP
jgi:hypothetical protein